MTGNISGFSQSIELYTQQLNKKTVKVGKALAILQTIRPERLLASLQAQVASKSLKQQQTLHFRLTLTPEEHKAFFGELYAPKNTSLAALTTGPTTEAPLATATIVEISEEEAAQIEAANHAKKEESQHSPRESSTTSEESAYASAAETSREPSVEEAQKEEEKTEAPKKELSVNQSIVQEDETQQTSLSRESSVKEAQKEDEKTEAPKAKAHSLMDRVSNSLVAKGMMRAARAVFNVAKAIANFVKSFFVKSEKKSDNATAVPVDTTKSHPASRSTSTEIKV